MKRNRINILLLILFVFIFQLKAQEIIDTANMRITYRVCQKALKNNEPIVITDTMALDIGHNWSKYYDLYRNYKDSIDVYLRLNNDSKGWSRFSNDTEALRLRLESLQEPTDLIYKRKNGESAVVYKNRKKNEITTIDEGQMEMPDTYTLFRFTEYILPQQWKIEKDTLTVLQYPCQKATTSFRGRNYTAWFSIDIPINEGPWKLYGLPGLILKVEDGDMLFTFSAIGIEKIDSKPILIESQKRWNDGRKLIIDYQFRDCDLKKWQAFKKNQYKKITIGFSVGNDIYYYHTKNPIIYNWLEIED